LKNPATTGLRKNGEFLVPGGGEKRPWSGGGKKGTTSSLSPGGFKGETVFNSKESMIPFVEREGGGAGRLLHKAVRKTPFDCVRWKMAMRLQRKGRKEASQ